MFISPGLNPFDATLNERLQTIRDQGLYRELRRVDSAQSSRIQIGGRAFLNFSSNDYLGLANDPLLKNAATEAIERYGVGTGASRLICGSLAPHHKLDEALADFKGTEAALSFSSGYATALGTICALMDRNDVIILDKLVHASIVDAARLSGARLRVFPHNNLTALERILDVETSRNTQHATRILIVTESIFSMDGDQAPLPEIVSLKDKYNAWLMVDEAHATGIFGENGRGQIEQLGLSGRVEIQMGTLGKALGVSGGFICGSRPLIELLVNCARSFIFSTAPIPANAAAAKAAIEFVKSEAGKKRREQLWQRVDQFKSKFEIRNSKSSSAIIPIVMGAELKAVEAAIALRERGIFVPAIRYPTVARGAARLRVTLTAAHSAADVCELAGALNQIANRKS